MIASTASTTTVLVVLLVLIGLVMIGAAVWLVVATRRDAPALGPLEVMGDRRFTRAAPEARVATLDGARPPGALPPAPMVPFDDAEPVAAAAADGVEPVVAASPVVQEAAEPDAVDGEVAVADQGESAPEPEPDATTELAGPSAAATVEHVEDLEDDEDDEVELEIDDRVSAPEPS